MRTRTFVFSFVVHTLVIGAAMVVRLFAAAELPPPPQNTMFAMVASELPEVQPPPVRTARTSSTPAVNNDAARLGEPDSIAPEIFVPFDIAPTGADTIIGAVGDPAGDVGVPPPPPAPRAVVPLPPVVRVGGVVRAPQKVHHIAPSYPPIAQAAKISGVWAAVFSRAVGSAPFAISIPTIASPPTAAAAKCSAVAPLLVVRAVASAPASSSTRTTSAWPARAATWSGV